MLNFKNAIKERIGEEYYPFIDHELVNVANTKVLRVDCRQSDDPCFLDGKEFYVQTNPATDKLEGKKQVDYIRNRFQQ